MFVGAAFDKNEAVLDEELFNRSLQFVHRLFEDYATDVFRRKSNSVARDIGLTACRA